MTSFRIHCGSSMRYWRTDMMSGNTHHTFQCIHCGYKEREVRTPRGHLLSWRNLSRLAREAAGVVKSNAPV